MWQGQKEERTEEIMSYPVVTNVGIGIIANRIKGTGTEPKYVAWGTGANGGTDYYTPTDLITPALEARTSGTSSLATTVKANDTYRVVGEITCTGASKVITEVGLFDALTVGNLFVATDFTAINVSPGDSIEFTVDVKLIN